MLSSVQDETAIRPKQNDRFGPNRKIGVKHKKVFSKNSSLVTSRHINLIYRDIRCDELFFQLVTCLLKPAWSQPKSDVYSGFSLSVMSWNSNSSRFNHLSYRVLRLDVTSDEFFIKNFLFISLSLNFWFRLTCKQIFPWLKLTRVKLTSVIARIMLF